MESTGVYWIPACQILEDKTCALPPDHRLRPHDHKSGSPVFPDRHQPNPKQSIPAAQPWTLHVSLENGQLLTHRRIFQSDLLVTTEPE
jgi:hypothetical protein